MADSSASSPFSPQAMDPASQSDRSTTLYIQSPEYTERRYRASQSAPPIFPKCIAVKHPSFGARASSTREGVENTVNGL